jgi:hypothetical protein
MNFISPLVTTPPTRLFALAGKIAKAIYSIPELEPLGKSTGIDVGTEPSIRLAFILFLTSPANPSFPTTAFVTGLSKATKTEVETMLKFEIPLSSGDNATISSYDVKRICVHC